MKMYFVAATALLAANVALSSDKGVTVTSTLGTTGLGLEVSKLHNDSLSFRAALNGVSDEDSSVDDSLRTEAKLTLGGFGGFVDYRLSRFPGVYFSAGLVGDNTSLEAESRAATTSSASLSVSGSETVLSFGDERFVVKHNQEYQAGDLFYSFDGVNLTTYNKTTAGAAINSTNSSYSDVAASINGGSVRVDAKIAFKNKIAPYLGVGYRYRFGQNDSWEIGGSAGVLLTGGVEGDFSTRCVTSDASCNAIKGELDKEILKLRDDFDEAVDDAPSFWPVLNIGVGYRF